MKKISTFLFSLVILLSVSGKIFAQEKATKGIASVKEDGRFVNFNLTSSKPFIFGNNRYILHIGSNDFYNNKQSFSNGIGSMTFFIPVDDFNALQEGADIYLTYGQLTTINAELDELSKGDHVPCWSLGKFSKTLLTK